MRWLKIWHKRESPEQIHTGMKSDFGSIMNTSSIERSKQEFAWDDQVLLFVLCLGSGWDLINYSHNYLKVIDFPLTRKKENPENRQQQQSM